MILKIKNYYCSISWEFFEEEANPDLAWIKVYVLELETARDSSSLSRHSGVKNYTYKAQQPFQNVYLNSLKHAKIAIKQMKEK